MLSILTHSIELIKYYCTRLVDILLKCSTFKSIKCFAVLWWVEHAILILLLNFFKILNRFSFWNTLSVPLFWTYLQRKLLSYPPFFKNIIEYQAEDSQQNYFYFNLWCHQSTCTLIFKNCNRSKSNYFCDCWDKICTFINNFFLV